MNKIHPLKEIIINRKNGGVKGCFSVCSANEYVIEAALEKGRDKNAFVLIEATANQINQFGGYTGMNPVDFREYVYAIARKVGFTLEKLILGGDHLGPLVWSNEDEHSAMEKSEVLIREYVSAGFTKIHLDTSMRLASDDQKARLKTETIAQRGARLCKVSEEAYAKLLLTKKDAVRPVYVIGSEVPIPGGSQEAEDSVAVTSVKDFEETIAIYRKEFSASGLNEAFENVIAVVVQPGVEFGNAEIHDYSRSAARELSGALKHHPGIVFEGHSTDYQTPANMKQMVEDGIAILKVGPGLTFALREALFALSLMENAIMNGKNIESSHFINVLDAVMVAHPENWEKHYHGDESKIAFERKYSLSDRSRYYLGNEDVQKALHKMIENLRANDIPLTLISQFLPVQFRKIRSRLLEKDPVALIKDKVAEVLDDYYFAL